jgi:YidC/Oxa1 family membrane protein insertase
MSSLLAAPMGATYTVIVVLCHLFAPVLGGLAAAAAIVAITIGIRLLLTPLTWYAMRGQARVAALAPRVRELRTRYRSQPDRLQAELGALYRQNGPALLAGVLPLLLQLPAFAILYRLLESPTIGGARNVLLRHDVLGASLGSRWLSGAGPVSGHGLVFLGLFALLAAVGWLSLRAARPSQGTEDPVHGSSGALMQVLPFTTLVVAAFAPLAAGLYLLASTGWAVGERVVLGRRVGVPPAVQAATAVAGQRRAGSGP